MSRSPVLALALVLALGGALEAVAQGEARESPAPRITLRVKEMPVVELLSLLADFASLNLVAGDDVKGRVTVELMNVPWHQAFEVVARSRELHWELEENVLLVRTAQAHRQELVRRVEAQEADVALAPRRLRLLPVHHARAAELVPQVKLLLGEQAKVSVDPRTNTLILLSP